MNILLIIYYQSSTMIPLAKTQLDVVIVGGGIAGIAAAN